MEKEELQSGISQGVWRMIIFQFFSGMYVLELDFPFCVSGNDMYLSSEPLHYSLSSCSYATMMMKGSTDVEPPSD